MKSSYDVVDVHVSSLKSRLDSVLEHPLLDGQKKYTLQVTEFSMPLSLEGPLPANEKISEPADVAPRMLLLQVRAKLIGQQPGANATLLSNVPLIGGQFGPVPPSTNSRERFVPTSIRPMRTPNDLVYYLQRYFDDIKAKYILTSPLVGADHGGGGPVVFDADTQFVTVTVEPNGILKFFFSEIFTKHFYIGLTRWGATLLGLGDEHQLVAFRTHNGNILVGQNALTNNEDANLIVGDENGIAVGVNETVEHPCLYPIERHFDHRVRLEVESQMGTPATTAWTTKNLQKISHVIGTFPIITKTQTSVLCNSEGTPTGHVRYQTDLLVGDLVWRRAEDKISEKYVLSDSNFFHNIRLEVFIVRKEWLEIDNGFIFVKEKLTFEAGENWSAKVRFRSI